MARNSIEIPDAEFAVMSVLWEESRTTGRFLTDNLYPGGTPAHYSTVQKLLERLEQKKFVKRDRTAWPHEFVPMIDREEFITRQLQATADKLCQGSLAPILSHLVKANLGRKQLSKLRELINTMSAEK